MKKINCSLFILFLLSSIACSTVKESSSSRVKRSTSFESDKTVINYNRTISSEQATYIAQLMREQLDGFPKDDLPIRFENNTKNSTLHIHLKKRKVKLNYRSTLNLNAGNQEVMTVHQLREKIAAL